MEKKSSNDVANGNMALSPQDIEQIKGRFSSGAVVRLLDQQGEELGLGIVNIPQPS